MIVPLLVVQILFFVGLIFFVRFLFQKNFQIASDRLKKLHQDNLEREQELKEELERAKRERQLEAERGRKEADLFVKEAKKESEAVKQKIIEQAETEAKKVIQQAREQLEREKLEIQENVAEKAMDVSANIVESLLSAKSKEAFAGYLIEELIDDLNNLNPHDLPSQVSSLKIVSALALTAPQKDKIKDIFRQKIGREMDLSIEVDPSLIGGFIVNVGDFVVDGSLRNRLKKILPLIKKEYF